MTLQSLLTRAQQATGASRAIDFELHILLVGAAVWPATDMRGRITNPHSKMSDYLGAYREVIDADDQDFDFPRYTASVDAALGLVERVLPGWFVGNICQTDYGRWYATVTRGPPSLATYHAQSKTVATPALALICALLSAKIAEASTPHEEKDS